MAPRPPVRPLYPSTPSLSYICPAAATAALGAADQRTRAAAVSWTVCRRWHEKHDLHETHGARDCTKIREGLQFKGKSRKQAGWLCLSMAVCVCAGGACMQDGRGDFRGGRRRATKNQFMSRASQPFARFGSCFLNVRVHNLSQAYVDTKQQTV